MDLDHLGAECVMSEVNPIAGNSGAPMPSSIGRVHLEATGAAAAPGTQATSRAQGQDRVELSDHARHLERLRQIPDVRQGKVEAAKAAIANGVYESPDRLRAALLRMLNEIDGG
jgi:flagellar biosynthesis anti-sigma factor FlgM